MAYRIQSSSDSEDDVIENSFADENVPNQSLTVDESDSDDSDIIRRATGKKNKRVGQKKKTAVIDSDSEDEQFEKRVLSPRTRMSITGVRPPDLLTSDESSETEYEAGKSDKGDSEDGNSDEDDDQFERRALSPRTRMSITGFKPRDLSSNDSSEIEYTDEEEMKSNGNKRKESGSDSGNEESTAEKTMESSSNKNNEKSGSSGSYKSVQADTPQRNGINEEESIAISDSDEPTELHSYNAESPLKNRRFTGHFENSISKKLSSTVFPDAEQKSQHDDSDVIAISVPNNIINISSSPETSHGPSSSTPLFLDTKKMIQPKISAAMPGTPLSAKQNKKQLVSRDFYDKEAKKVEDLKNELRSSENLLETIASKLPDNGKQLMVRVEQLKRDIRKKAEVLGTYEIEENTKANKSGPKAAFFNIDAPNWDDLAAAVNQIQPKHTGKQGLATFENQKALTVERLKDIHGSLETCPTEDVLADDPKGLTVTLMEHQKHAIAWMRWREQQKPRGGILADDMGLGKTLTMISLILDSKNRAEEGVQSESDDSEVEEANDGWTAKGRRDYYDGGTLIVCPASLLSQWEGEAERRIKRNILSCCVHHGNNRDSKPRQIKRYDMVVTTYNIVSREAKTQGALFGIKWNRVILDEAHVVRNHKSQSSIGVCQLKSKYRWALTGTPIQNKEMDLYAILKFLKCSPFDDLTHWKKWIDNKSAGGQQRLNTLMKSLMLRRTKLQLQEKGALMSLPSKEILLIDVALDKEEMNVYQKVMIFSRSLFAQFLHQRAEKNSDMYFTGEANKATYMQSKDPNGAYYKMHQKISRLHGTKEVKSHEILVLLLRLRQICCHPGLIETMLEDDNDASGLTSCDEDAQPEIDLLAQLNKLEINDESNSESLVEGEQSMESQAIFKASAKVLQKNNPVFNLVRPSSKMKKVMRVLEEKVLNTPDKAIIVSQWTSVLNILKTHLDARGIESLSLNGSIAVKNRPEIVSKFNSSRDGNKILLLSLTAGGVGLNLVGANHLFLIDLHWNPQLESQAQDRIYRVGQKKDVFIYKFMCKDTIEERIKALQDKKMAIANGVLTGVKSTGGSKLTMDDLKDLFGFGKPLQ